MTINGKGMVVGHGVSLSGEPEVVIRMLDGSKIVAECRPFFLWGEMVMFSAYVLKSENEQNSTVYTCKLQKIEYL